MTGRLTPIEREPTRKSIMQPAILIVGYGFNDDHLQTHLEPQLR